MSYQYPPQPGYPPPGYPAHPSYVAPQPPPSKVSKTCLVLGITGAVVFLMLLGAAAAFVVWGAGWLSGGFKGLVSDAVAVASIETGLKASDAYYKKYSRYTDDPGALSRELPEGANVTFMRGTTPVGREVAVTTCAVDETQDGAVLLHVLGSDGKVFALYRAGRDSAYYANGVQTCPGVRNPTDPQWGSSANRWDTTVPFGSPTPTRRS